MKTKITLCALVFACYALYADINSVSVPSGMVHPPSAGMGLGFSGKVEYSLTPLTNDSIFVTLSIVPSEGGEALALTEVSGDVGLIHVNTNLPNSSKKYGIFFQTASPQAGVQYVARVTAEAVVSAKKTEVNGFLASMSKQQKAVLMGSEDAPKTTNASGPIPNLYTLDGPHGVCVGVELGGGTATSFSTSAGVACSWDTTLARIRGEMIAEEFRAYGRNCALGPAGNIVHHPQLGRASEYYSEDPYLSGQMMAAGVIGHQNRGVMAVIKHFACNQMEYNRNSLSANMGERSLREIYLYNWEPSIIKANCWGIMGAYNKINGKYSCSNKYLMTDVLRNEWGYKYTVVTDWFAGFDNISDAVKWGVDIELPTSSKYAPSNITGFADSIIDVHARRIINVHEELGSLKAGYNRTAYASTLKSAEHYQFVREAGAQGIVLAKNNGNILPLPKTGAKIAVTGPLRTAGGRISGEGSCWVTPVWGDVPNPLNGLQQYLSGVAGASTIQDNNTSGADYIIVFVGPNKETEGVDRPYLALQASDGETAVAQALAVTGAKTVVVYTGGSASTPGNWSNADAVVIQFYPGMKSALSLADVIFGDVNPSGKLPVTFPASANQLPNFSLTNNNLVYPRADSAHGYFRVDKMGAKPLFYFGHGLSYTTFSYTNLQIYPTQISAGDRVRVSVTVTNTGSKAGKEVVQLYLSMPNTNSSLPVRVQDLRGFNKISLNAGESKTVSFTLTEEEMRVFNPNGADYNGSGFWQVLAGTYGVRVGTSADREAQPSVSGNFTVQ